jgi:hypothetical protein
MECHQVGHSTRWKELNKVLECSACHNQCCNQKENDKEKDEKEDREKQMERREEMSHAE